MHASELTSRSARSRPGLSRLPQPDEFIEEDDDGPGKPDSRRAGGALEFRAARRVRPESQPEFCRMTERPPPERPRHLAYPDLGAIAGMLIADELDPADKLPENVLVQRVDQGPQVRVVAIDRGRCDADFRAIARSETAWAPPAARSSRALPLIWPNISARRRSRRVGE